MKSLLFGVCAIFALLVAVEASAQTIVLNPPGPFNRTVIRGGGPGTAVAASVNRPGFSASAAIGGFNAQARANNFGPRQNFGGQAAAAASFNGFNVSASAGRNNNFNHARFNSFGTRTIQNRNGDVFEQDANGNVRFVGNRFNNGFSGRNTGFNRFNSFGHGQSFNSFGHGQSFNSFGHGFSVNSFGVRNLGGGFCH